MQNAPGNHKFGNAVNSSFGVHVWGKMDFRKTLNNIAVLKMGLQKLNIKQGKALNLYLTVIGDLEPCTMVVQCLNSNFKASVIQIIVPISTW
jgi:hypothetical protein